ncbi:TIGR01777 family oxidoreductase [Microbacterium sp.]|uniref:TIGR01777 family oxidoreductase n=1 Tax=Microbacterium sp. TaxID=51671 RepID=UPI003A88C5C0
MPDRIVLAGGSGLIGRALADALTADGIPVVRLVRRPARGDDEVTWEPGETLDPGRVDGARAVVCLNGASIGRFPWTAGYKKTLLWSRITSTRTIATAVQALGDSAPPFVCASAVGYYPRHAGAPLTEDSARGDGFLADVCGEWESAAAAAGDRVAHLRTAPVVHPGGVLGPLMLLTRLGLSGRIGRGTQVWPWISLDDEVRAIRHIIDTGMVGPVNLAGPSRATANDLGFALARRMNRPFLLPAPEWALTAVLGADATRSLLTSDMHVVPEALTASGFTFRHATVEEAVAAGVPSR